MNDFETYLRNLSDRELDLLWRDYCSENAKYHNLERASAIHAETERRRPMEYYDGDWL